MNLTAGYFGWFQKKPDLQIAYVGSVKLPDDTVASLEQIFASLAEDYNGDGSILVQVNQYVSGSPELSDAESASYRYAAEVTLIGDINDCESYFFLMELPEDFQRTYQILAMPDGSCPDDLDFSSGVPLMLLQMPIWAVTPPRCLEKKLPGKIRNFYQVCILEDVVFIMRNVRKMPKTVTPYGTL
jgi:hypothetical protein